MVTEGLCVCVCVCIMLPCIVCVCTRTCMCVCVYICYFIICATLLTKFCFLCRPFTDPHAGLIQNPCLCLSFQSDRVWFSWQYYFTMYAEGQCNQMCDIATYLDELLPCSGYVVCPGIKDYPSEIRFKTKNLVEWGAPFN